ncbi:MAG: rod shape-determining protein MreC [Firmicutes bacterium]|nr:rod shape-determining protein MreC [Bacillota bacterium]
MLSPQAKRKARKIRIAVLVAVFLLLLIMAGITADRRGQGITWLEEILQYVMAPVQGAFQQLTSFAESFFASIKDYQLLLAENAKLRERLAAATALETSIAELKQENERLRRMLELREASEYELIAAEVIARDPSSWFKTITINKGARHGIEQNMAVITTDGLVGSILSVAPNSAHVLLLTDERSAVSALVQRSREPGEVGLIENDPENPGALLMKNLPRDANIQPGDTIISSGLGGLFPKGLLIGYVSSTAEDKMSLTQYAVVQPAVNFNRLEEVFVVVTQEKVFPAADDAAEEGS